MYQPKPWEQNDHAGYGSHSSAKEKKYHKEERYGSGNPGSEYMKTPDSGDKDDKKESIFEDTEELKKDEELKEEDIIFKAAKQVFAETQEQRRDKGQKKKSLDSIEEAVKKAIEDEKKVIMMD